jgi:nascent polypeptide-associated complex subunit alpha
MIPGMNPRKAAQIMKRMGISQQEIDATQVIIRTPEKELVIRNPQVSKVNMMGQQTFQVMGEVEERAISSEPEINKDDIKTVVEQTGVSEEEAKEAIKRNDFDLAKAIIELKK